jgi:hypothetical protein
VIFANKFQITFALYLVVSVISLRGFPETTETFFQSDNNIGAEKAKARDRIV